MLLSMIWLIFFVLNQLYFNATDPLSELWRRAWVIPAFWSALSYVLLAIICALWSPSRSPTGYSICYEVHRLLIWVELFIWGLYVWLFQLEHLSNLPLPIVSWICLLLRWFILLMCYQSHIIMKGFPLCPADMLLESTLPWYFEVSLIVFDINTYVTTNTWQPCLLIRRCKRCTSESLKVLFLLLVVTAGVI